MAKILMWNMINSIKEKYNALSIATLLSIHFFICSFGVIRLYIFLVAVLEKIYKKNTLKVALDKSRYFDWIMPFFFPTHKYTIFAFFCSAALLVTLFILIYVIATKIKLQKYISPKAFHWIYIVDLLFIIQMLSLHNQSINSSFLTLILWGILFQLPFYQFFTQKDLSGIINKFAKFSFIVICLEFLFLFVPLSTENIFILNEYFDIPSQTYIKDKNNTSPKVLDNIQYINQEKLWGNHLRYDMRIDNGQDPECLEGNFIKIDSIEIREHLVNLNKNRFYIHYPSNKLCFIGKMSNEQYNNIKAMLPSKYWGNLLDSYMKNGKIYGKLQEKHIKMETIDFLNENKFENLQTVHDLELTFHHHFQFLNPIHELTLGRPIQEIIALYGTNFLFLKSILDLSGGVTYESFLHLMFSTYIIYYIFFIALVAYIVRDIRYVTAFFLFAFASIKGLGFITLFIGLGFTPIRHILDIFVIFLFYKYLISERPKWLIATLIVAVAGLVSDRFLGLFIITALFGTLIVKLIFNHTANKRIELSVLVAGSIISLSLFTFLGNITAVSPYNQGFLDGMWGFPVSLTKVAFILFCLIFTYTLFIFAFSKHFKNIYYLPLLLVFYVQIFLLYWLIVPNYGHLYIIYPYIAVTLIIITKYIIEPVIPRKLGQFLTITIFCIGSLFYIYTSAKIWHTYHSYNKVAQDHVVHDWNFPNMHVQSSMAPQYFAKGVNLIEKYSYNNKGVHIISKYDTLLLYLSHKYSLMPHFEVGTILNGHELFNIALKKIEHDNPEIIFVDTDIKRNQLTVLDTMDTISPLPSAYIMRIERKIDRLTRIKDLFEKIESRYEKIEQTELIAVYRRI